MTENKTTQDYIADGFIAYKKLAKYALRYRWKKMNLAEKCTAARALVVMDIVSKYPNCLSREESEKGWRANAKEYAKAHNFKEQDYKYAFYFVQDPKGFIWEKTVSAMEYPLSSEYYNFLKNVQDYEYSSDWLKYLPAREIKEDSERVAELLRQAESRVKIEKIWSRFKKNFTR